MNTVFLSIGTNIGQREENLREAVDKIEAKAGRLTAMSSVYETVPWEMAEGGLFLNMAARIETLLDPYALLETALEIENGMGRKREGPGYCSRIIDIDILFFNDLIINDKHLHIPHPLIAGRRFVLEPLAEIAPQLVHPCMGKSVESLLESCIDRHAVKRTGIKL
jgi:2-amino-4-hydroxy-6-hydroxymethyldihydropteridine diphosphokinase